MSKIAIITGASRGIGYEICQTLRRIDHQVIAVARSETTASGSSKQILRLYYGHSYRSY
ncbi:MAG: SDR family NAD(P)-dependent oxidoreductase [Fodinibius sp.]|nr:SDR family NAD(P)-dependent oxidoreductase [Fodinibius sp.]